MFYQWGWRSNINHIQSPIGKRWWREIKKKEEHTHAKRERKTKEIIKKHRIKRKQFYFSERGNKKEEVERREQWKDENNWEENAKRMQGRARESVFIFGGRREEEG